MESWIHGFFGVWLETIWSGYVNEMGDVIDTSLVGLSLLMTFLATLCLVWECVLFYFLRFIMNLFVTWRSRYSWVVLQAACSVHLRQHVKASNNPFITLLPIQNVLFLNHGYWSDCVYFDCLFASLQDNTQHLSYALLNCPLVLVTFKLTCHWSQLPPADWCSLILVTFNLAPSD
jgi:hypothetical protein